jgi:hypothetical protein
MERPIPYDPGRPADGISGEEANTEQDIGQPSREDDIFTAGRDIAPGTPKVISSHVSVSFHNR